MGGGGVGASDSGFRGAAGRREGLGPGHPGRHSTRISAATRRRAHTVCASTDSVRDVSADKGAPPAPDPSATAPPGAPGAV
jgi:hypothetical protein